jgi:nucleoid DNA-binding protein/cell division septation protein DedD
MNLSKYIRQLLSENETVIIPGLGAFITEYKPSQMDEESSELGPPSREITFNTKIRSNDGLLMEFIAHSEHISAQEALQKIEKEREEMLYQLDKGEKVKIKGIGGLYYDESRNIRFLPSEKELSAPEAFGLEKISLKEEAENTREEKEDVILVDNFKEATEKTKPQMEAESVAKEMLPEEKTEGKPKKKRRSWLWLLVLLIPILLAGVFLFRKEKKEPPAPVKITVEPPKPEEIPIVASDSLVKDTAAVVEDEPGEQEFAEELDPSSIIQPEPTKFYLIGGSFIDAENAEKYFQRMKNQGYDPFHLGKQGSFFLVGLEIHDNEIEAYGAQYNFLDKYPDSGVWVFIPE